MYTTVPQPPRGEGEVGGVFNTTSISQFKNKVLRSVLFNADTVQWSVVQYIEYQNGNGVDLHVSGFPK